MKSLSGCAEAAQAMAIFDIAERRKRTSEEAMLDLRAKEARVVKKIVQKSDVSSASSSLARKVQGFLKEMLGGVTTTVLSNGTVGSGSKHMV